MRTILIGCGCFVTAIVLMVLWVEFSHLIPPHVFLLLLFIPYWAPTMIGALRGHPDSLAIGVLNFFAGWTVFGWFAGLVWACTGRSSSYR